LTYVKSFQCTLLMVNRVDKMLQMCYTPEIEE